MDYNYNFDYSYAMDDEIGAMMAGFYAIYYLVMFAVGVAGYVLRSLGTHTIAKRRGIGSPWLAWIPVVNVWILGSISDQYRYVTKGQIKSKRKILLVLSIISAAMVVVFFGVFFGGFIGMMESAMTGVEEAIISDVLSMVLSMMGVGLVMAGISIALAVFRYMALYDLYTSVNPPYNVVFLVLSIFFNVTEPYFIFFNRKKDLGMPPRCDVPVEPVAAEPQYLPPQPSVQEPWESNPEAE